MTVRADGPAGDKPLLAATVLAATMLAAAVLALFLTAPSSEGFWWTDAATFALNGDFVRDYIATGLATPPMAFANAWFLRYPALTISLYPPVFPLAEAVVFALFGFSHVAAQATVAAFTALAAWGAYVLGRTAMPALAAAAFALVMLATPAILLWSRQVMMEVPSLAFVLLGAVAVLRYQAAGGPWRLFLAVSMVLAATYTKQTAIFSGVAFAAALLIGAGPGLLRRRAVWFAAAAGLAGLLPLVAFTIKFAPQLIDIAAAQGPAGKVDRLSVATLVHYCLALPNIAGWLPLLAAAGYLVVVAVRGWGGIAERRLVTLMLCWFAAAYVFATFVGHFEDRYGLMLAVPPAALAVLLILRLLQRRRQTVAAVAGATFFIVSVAAEPIPWVGGYGAVAAAILRNTDQNDVILFDGDDSKSLAFSLRARSPAPKIYMLRAEKLLVNYNTIRDWGIQDRNVSQEDIAAMIKNSGVTLVALQPGFWTDQPSMARLEAYVMSDAFERVDSISVEAEQAGKQVEIRLFRTRNPGRPTAQTIHQLESRQ